MSAKAEIVICGAGVAGVAAAHHLVVRHGVRGVVLVDERPPLSLTSAFGTEAYRNWWPDRPMFRFMDRSIDLMDEMASESGNAARMNRRGYVFLTADRSRIPVLQKEAEAVSNLGGGALRVHRDESSYVPSQPEGLEPGLSGADLLLDADSIAEQFPFLADDTAAMLHVRRCGWMDVPSLGRWMLERIESEGGRIVRDRITKVGTRNNRIDSVTLESGSAIETEKLVLAVGPLAREAGLMMDLEVPVFMELHAKVTVEDTANVLPADAPMMLWTDPIELVWNDDERERHARCSDTRYLTEPFPAGLHIRPRFRDGKQTFLGIWTYDVTPREASFPPDFDPVYPVIVLRGLARMIPAMRQYFDTAGRVPVDGGYYCKTPDNRPLIGPLPVEGAYIVGALSGYGVMGSQAAGELIAAHVTGAPLPDYAEAFSYDRFEGMLSHDTHALRNTTRGQL